MAYATSDDLKTRFGTSEITATPEDAGAVAVALDDASELIDTYIGERYTLPLTVVPGFLVRITCDIARYYLYDDQATDRVKEAYDNAIKFLDEVKSGDVSLGDIPASETTSGPEHYDGVLQFTDNDMIGY